MRPSLILRLFIPLVLSLNLAACSVLAPATPTPTPAPTLTPTPSPEPANCFYTQNPGPPPPDVVTRAQTAFAATGLQGEVSVNGYGEYNSCGGFGLMEVDFEISIVAPDLTDQKAMAVQALKVANLPKDALQKAAPLGNFKIRFKTADHFCWWDSATQTCGEALVGP